MAASPFRNFNPEALGALTSGLRPIAGSHAVTDLIRRAAFACNGSARMSNSAIIGIIEHIPTYFTSIEPRRVSYLDYYSDYPAHLALDGITYEKYNAGRALMLVDETLTMIETIGWNADVADRLLLATSWISDAKEKVADDLRHHEYFGAVETLTKQRDADILEVGRMSVRQQVATGRETAAQNKKKRNADELKARALSLYEAGMSEKVWPSKAKAADDIFPQIQAYAKGNSLCPFAPTNARRTIYEHLLKHA